MVPDLKDFRLYYDTSDRIPLYEVVEADTETPISVYCKLVGDRRGFILESVEGGEHLGRYSMIGFDAYCTLVSRDQKYEIHRSKEVEQGAGQTLDQVRRLLQEEKIAPVPGLPRFFGGAVGYFGYELVAELEKIPVPTEDPLGLPDCHLMFPEKVVVFDHLKHVMQLIVLIQTTGNVEADYAAAKQKIEDMKSALNQAVPPRRIQTGTKSPLTKLISREKYMAMVEEAKEAIFAGDIFQVVPSQRMEAPLTVEPFEVYRTLRSVNPSPYLYYFNFDSLQLIGSSPEILVRVEERQVETRPIAGTVRRGQNDQEDLKLAEELLADEKERAEHLMLVDLGRNDIGRVCQYGTVKVPDFMIVEKYSHVMHLVSSVQGRLKPDLDAVAVLKACFPAGTLSGAPKVRAMEIIAELEPFRRGPYGGAVGYIGYSGNMDTCINIRTFVVTKGKIYAQAGAGIVADSDPAKEYEETINKAQALFKALALTEEGKRCSL